MVNKVFRFPIRVKNVYALAYVWNTLIILHGRQVSRYGATNKILAFSKWYTKLWLSWILDCDR